MKKFRVLFSVICALVFCFCITRYYAPTAYAEADTVFVGGYPIGISVDIDGLLVESVIGVETEYGMAAVEGLYRGDIIKKMNGVEVETADDVTEMLSGEPVKLDIVRGGVDMEISVTPVTEAYTQKPKLGVKIKDKIYGVGTVTFVRSDGRFAALGHEMCDGELGMRVPFDGGHIHACKVVGVKRGTKNEAGAIIATLLPEKIYGSLTCNNSFGVAGNYAVNYDKTISMQLASRDEVKPGAATIRTSVGGEPEEFTIEIIKASKQAERGEKGMVFRVTDKRLLEMTGGIVRGMSGSPIIQNGKVVGAVTHVFLNDFTKGYGIYADFLN